MTTRDFTPLAGILAAMLLLSGCDRVDPYKREGMWRPEGVVNANLAAQLANPHDLVRGRSDSSPLYREGTMPVTKLWAGAPAQSAANAPSAFGGAAGGGAGAPPK